MCRKMILRTVKVPVGLTLNEIAKAWAFLNQMIFKANEGVVWHWRGNDRRNGRFLVFPLKRDRKKFRYRAFARATKFKEAKA